MFALPTEDIYIYIYIHTQGGLRRGGLTPALAPRMPVIPRMYDTNYREKNGRLKCGSNAKGYTENKSCLNEKKKTLGSDAVNHGNEFCNPAHDDEHHQQRHQPQYSNTLRSSRQVYTNAYSYVVHHTVQ